VYKEFNEHSPQSLFKEILWFILIYTQNSTKNGLTKHTTKLIDSTNKSVKKMSLRLAAKTARLALKARI